MRWLLQTLLLACAATMLAAPQQKPAPNDIFSGNVTEISPESITVARKIPAKDTVTRKFLRDANTKVEGPLKILARVTVRFQTDSEGQFHALHIIVRDSDHR